MAVSKSNEVALLPRSARILCTSLSRHWEFLWLVFSGIVICYTLRVNMSVAAQTMVDELHWTETQRGNVLSAFYWGYSLGQIPASYLMMRGTFSPKWTFGLAVFLPSIMTIMVPLCARQSYQMALAIRMLIGCVESATFPACYQFYIVWIPPAAKTFMIATMLSGTFMGEIVGFSLSGILIDSEIKIAGTDFGGWPSVFYLFGVMGVVWFPFWAIYAYETPEVHPGVSTAELDYIKGVGGDPNDAHTQGGAIGKGAPLPLGGIADAALGRAYSRASTDSTRNHYNFAADRADSSSNEHAPLTSVDIQSQHHVSSTLTTKLLADSSNPMYGKTPVSSEQTGLLDDSEADLSELDQEEREAQGEVRSLEINRNSDYGYNSGRDNDKGGVVAEQVPEEDAVEFDRIPWKHILSHSGFWNLLFGNYVYGFISFMLLSEIPFYLTDELGFSSSTAGVLATIPFGLMCVMAIGTGNFLTGMQRNRGWTIKQIRLTATILGFLVPAAFMLMVAVIPMDKWGKYVCLVLATMFLGANQAGIACAYGEFAPQFSPFINTISNALAAVAGIMGPVIVSALLTANKSSGWEETFIICATMCCTAVFVWYFYAVSEPVYLCNKMLPKRN